MEHSLKKIYKQIRKLSEGSSYEIAFDPTTNYIFRTDNEDLSFHFVEDPSHVSAGLERLMQQGYIESTRNVFHFCLTFKGMHPWEVGLEETKSFFMKSILTPIIVSIITTLAATAILQFFSSDVSK